MSGSGSVAGGAATRGRRGGFPHGLLETIDGEGKAWLLGWIAAAGSVTREGVRIAVRRGDRDVIDQFGQVLGCPLPRTRGGGGALDLRSARMAKDAVRHLGIAPGRRGQEAGFPALSEVELRWAFLRGRFDAKGEITRPRDGGTLRCRLPAGSARVREAVLALSPSRPLDDPGSGWIEWRGNNALDFLGRLYEGARFRLSRHWDLYRDWCRNVPWLGGHGGDGPGALFRWVRVLPEAVAPSKARPSDSGFDLTLVRRVKRTGVVEFYDTGIRVQPAYGWYLDVVPRSSLTRTGYILANSVGVIDRTYTGNILVSLIKVDPEAPELELPARIVQMIPRPIIHAELVEVEDLEATARGDGGFGSTGG